MVSMPGGRNWDKKRAEQISWFHPFPHPRGDLNLTGEAGGRMVLPKLGLKSKTPASIRLRKNSSNFAGLRVFLNGGAWMRDKVLIFLFLFASFPAAFEAQQSTTESSTKLTVTQKHGQLLFQQRCSVCHTMLSVTDRKTYGTRLYKDLVDGNEDLLRQSIMNGREGLMPGFKYGLTASEINDIIEYLKTVERPVGPSAWY